MKIATGPSRAVTTTYRVIYGDTDQMGVVYYANYLRWFEIGRNEWLRQFGSSYTSIERMGLRFPVTEVTCRYVRPARYDDEILIETTLSSLGRASLRFDYEIKRQGDGQLLSEGRTRHACVDKAGQLTKIPASVGIVLKAGVSA
jgi:acyl-CoA thioester hydrolase